MAAYESELTGFLRALKKERPELDDKQRQARALWWDRPADPDDVRRWQASQVKSSAYAYYPGPRAR
jgi:hypothetical protein